MPTLNRDIVHIAFDMHGCPNACRHCWLGANRTQGMTEADVRWAVDQFRAHVRPGGEEPFFNKVVVATSFREPDYADNYRGLHNLERELSDEVPPRYELLSVWRLARDKTCAPWAKSVGTAKCQVSFFGLQEATDWFCRRDGAFQDSLVATERLLEAGILPRWQFFLTYKILPDVDELRRLIDTMRLRERCSELGGEFELFIHPPGLDGPQRVLKPLIPTLEEAARLPAELLDATRKHFQRDVLWKSEGEYYEEVMQSEPWFPCGPDEDAPLWFFVTPNFDVFTNWGTLEPWWRLGNLRGDPLEIVLANFEQNVPLAYDTIRTVSPQDLVREYADKEGRTVFDSRDGLVGLCLAEHCAARYG